MDEKLLREKASAAVQAGKLPDRPPDRMWGGPGLGAECVVCERRIGREDLEFEVQWARDGARPDIDRFHFHVRCFAAWELERREERPGPR